MHKGFSINRWCDIGRTQNKICPLVLLVTSLGLADPRLVIHSLRHGGITRLHSAGVPVNIAETLTGHSAGNVHEQHVHKDLLSLKVLKEGLEKLRYAGVVKALT